MCRNELQPDMSEEEVKQAFSLLDKVRDACSCSTVVALLAVILIEPVGARRMHPGSSSCLSLWSGTKRRCNPSLECYPRLMY